LGFSRQVTDGVAGEGPRFLKAPDLGEDVLADASDPLLMESSDLVAFIASGCGAFSDVFVIMHLYFRAVREPG